MSGLPEIDPKALRPDSRQGGDGGNHEDKVIGMHGPFHETEDRPVNENPAQPKDEGLVVGARGKVESGSAGLRPETQQGQGKKPGHLARHVLIRQTKESRGSVVHASAALRPARSLGSGAAPSVTHGCGSVAAWYWSGATPPRGGVIANYRRASPGGGNRAVPGRAVFEIRSIPGTG